MNEALRDKKRFEGFRSLTPEERNSLRDWKPAITKKERDELRVLESKSTPVVAWYGHPSEVRGPFCRWFTCSDVNPDYQKHVGDKDDDCKFAAAAMNNLIPLLNALDMVEAENAKFRKALENIADPTYGTELCNSDAENNEILAGHHFLNQKVARNALA